MRQNNFNKKRQNNSEEMLKSETCADLKTNICTNLVVKSFLDVLKNFLKFFLTIISYLIFLLPYNDDHQSLFQLFWVT